MTHLPQPGPASPRVDPRSMSYLASMPLAEGGTSAVVSAGQDGGRVWEVVTGREIAALRGHSTWLQSASFSAEPAERAGLTPLADPISKEGDPRCPPVPLTAAWYME